MASVWTGGKRDEAFLRVDAKRDALEARLRRLRKDHADAERRLGRKRYLETFTFHDREREIRRLVAQISECEVLMFGVL